MWTKSNFALVAGFTQARRWLSWRFRDAPAGAVGLCLIVSTVLVLPLAASFGGTDASAVRALSVLFFFFPPSILGAVYSLFFEKSKLYGAFDLLLVTIVLRILPVTWYWLGLHLPTLCAFAVFCAVVRALKRRARR